MEVSIMENWRWNTKWKRPINSDYERGRISIGVPCVLRTTAIIACVCVCLCVTAVVIIFYGIEFTSTSPAKDVGQKAGATVASHAALRHIRDRSNYYDFKMNKRMKNWYYLILDLESVIIKLRNVRGKYDLKEEELKSLYPGVADCGRDKCGDFSDLLPKNQKLEQFNCKKFKKANGLKKRTSKLLSFFQRGVGNFEKSFQLLITFEESPEFRKQYLSNGSRSRILNELRTDLKTLSLEITEVANVTTNKRLNLQTRTMPLKHPESQTDLMINEWLVIQHSKEFLDKWRKQIEKVFRCWEKRIPKGFRKGLKKKKEKSPRKTISTSKYEEENSIDRGMDDTYRKTPKPLHNKIYQEEMNRRKKYFPRRRKYFVNP